MAKWSRREWLAAVVAGRAAFAFPASAEPITLPALLNEFRQIWIPARINGSPVLWCELDSGGGGAVYFIGAGTAAAIGVRGERIGQSAGVTGGQPAQDWRAQVTVEFPGLRLDRQELIIQPVLLGRDGIVGLYNFRQWVTEMDYETPAVRLHDAESFRYQGPGEAVAVLIEQTNPVAEVRLGLGNGAGEEVRGRFVVDTGAAGSLAYLTHSFAERIGLEARGLRWAADTMGNRAARIPLLSVGPYRVERAVIRVFPSRGFGGTAEPDGLLGAEFLRRFRLFFDYGREKLILEPNSAYPGPSRFDASGMRIYKDTAERRGLKVLLVVPGTPAAEAGIREGDLLLAVDHTPVDWIPGGQVAEMLMDEGTERMLLIERGASVLTIRLKLRRLL